MSKFIPERLLEEIRFRNDIVDVIGSYLSLKRTGSTYKACCPFHKEKTPSFNVNPNMQIFKCFGCGEGGDVIRFVMRHQGLDFVSAARVLAERAGITLDLEDDHGESYQRKVLYDIHSGIAAFYRRCLQEAPVAKAARSYMKERDITEDIAETFQIGYAPKGWDNAIKWGHKYGFSQDQLELAGIVLRSSREKASHTFYDRFRDRLVFPICDSRGRIVAFSARCLETATKQPKYVNSPETAIFSKSRTLYALDLARQNIVNNVGREAIICEGQIDVVRCFQHGFNTAVAAQGTAFTPDHVKLLKNYADSVVLVFDGDTAGRQAAIKTAHLFMSFGLIVRVAALAPNEDPDSYLCTHGPEAFRELLKNALSTVSFQIKNLIASHGDLRGIAATARIAKAVLESISYSPNAVQKERMLQEASELLKLPQHALEADLDVLERERAIKTSRHNNRHPSSPAPRSATPASITSEPKGSLLHSDHQRRSEPPKGSVGPSAPSSSNHSSMIHDADEQALCEHVYQGHDDPEVLNLIQSFLPLTMLTKPPCKRFIDAALKAHQQGTTITAFFQSHNELQDATMDEWFRALQHQPERIREKSDYSHKDAVQDLILKLWRRHLKKMREGLNDATSLEGEGPIIAERRRQLSMDMKSLQRWETGQDVIEIEMAMDSTPQSAPETP